MTMASQADLLRQEVEELTGLLREDPAWADLRKALREEGLALADLVLAGFFEDEDGHEFGAVVTAARRVFQFKRSSAAGSSGFLEWAERDNPEVLLDTFPAVVEAINTGKP
jgi:hypothetical protein